MSACSTNTSEHSTEKNIGSVATPELAVAQTITENFEQGSKGSYATGTLKLKMGEWEFDNVMVGSEKNDAKNGMKAARFKKDEQASLTMLYDFHESLTKVSVAHGLYGGDVVPATWELKMSTDGGKSWQRTGSVVTTTSYSLNTQTFTLNTTRPVRLALYKLSGGRLNIDDFSFNPGNIQPIADQNADTNPTMGDDTEAPLALGNPSDASPGNVDNLLLKKKAIR